MMAVLAAALAPAVHAYLNAPPASWRALRSRGSACQGQACSKGAFVTTLRPRPLRLRMAAGAPDSDKLAQAEAALDEAIASSDVNDINKWMKTIEKLQAAGV